MISNLLEFHEYCLQTNVKNRLLDLVDEWSNMVSGDDAYKLGIRDILDEINEDVIISSELNQEEIKNFLYQHCS
jgi:hypothetical protein